MVPSIHKPGAFSNAPHGIGNLTAKANKAHKGRKNNHGWHKKWCTIGVHLTQEI
jgi:hypothetical protein